jgi:hypothetical protein
MFECLSRCQFEEYAGGFDGEPTPQIDEGQEQDLDDAVKKLLPSGKFEQECFLKALVDLAKPTHLEYPAVCSPLGPETELFCCATQLCYA